MVLAHGIADAPFTITAPGRRPPSSYQPTTGTDRRSNRRHWRKSAMPHTNRRHLDRQDEGTIDRGGAVYTA